MFLTSFLALTALGLALFLIGHFFEYTGVATIGAIMLIAVGGTVASTQLVVQDGQQVEKSFTVVDNETVNNQTEVIRSTRPVAISDAIGGPVTSYSTGGMLMIVGGLLLTRHINEVYLE